MPPTIVHVWYFRQEEAGATARSGVTTTINPNTLVASTISIEVDQSVASNVAHTTTQFEVGKYMKKSECPGDWVDGQLSNA